MSDVSICVCFLLKLSQFRLVFLTKINQIKRSQFGLLKATAAVYVSTAGTLRQESQVVRGTLQPKRKNFGHTASTSLPEHCQICSSRPTAGELVFNECTTVRMYHVSALSSQSDLIPTQAFLGAQPHTVPPRMTPAHKTEKWAELLPLVYVSCAYCCIQFALILPLRWQEQDRSSSGTSISSNQQLS